MLRQEIEQIENNVLYAKDRVDRICDLIGKTAEGMPKPNSTCPCDACWAAKKELDKCQAYWQKELGINRHE